MALSTTLSIRPDEIAGAAELRRIKRLATLVLFACLAVFVIARLLQHLHPAFGFVAAFAEAATIGGLADWYAVVALFRHPLGLPIPHTAILQSNQDRIADKLGEFIEGHFLEPGPVEAKLREIDFAAFMSDWLCDTKRSNDLARFVLRLMPDAITAIEASGVKRLVTRQIMAQLKAFDLAPVAAGAARNFIGEGRHQGLLDDLLRALHQTLTTPETVAVIRDKIRQELPTLLKLYRADAFLVKRILASATTFFEEVRNDPQHPFRAEFDQMLLNFMGRLETDPTFASRIEGLKRDLLNRPELADLVQGLWTSLTNLLTSGAGNGDGQMRTQLAKLFAHVGTSLAADEALRAEVNAGVVSVMKSFIADQKGGVSSFIANQVKSWDLAQLITLIEINIGRDLQYIRFNGAVIGGLAGLALYTAEYLLRYLWPVAQ